MSERFDGVSKVLVHIEDESLVETTTLRVAIVGLVATRRTLVSSVMKRAVTDGFPRRPVKPARRLLDVDVTLVDTCIPF